MNSLCGRILKTAGVVSALGLLSSLIAEPIWIQETASAPWSGRAYHGVAVHGGSMWVLKGLEEYTYSGGSYSSEVWSSSNGTDWTQTADALANPEGMSYAALSYNNNLWLIGGGGC